MFFQKNCLQKRKSSRNNNNSKKNSVYDLEDDNEKQEYNLIKAINTKQIEKMFEKYKIDKCLLSNT